MRPYLNSIRPVCCLHVSELHAVKVVKGEGITPFLLSFHTCNCDSLCSLFLIVSFHCYRIKLTPCLILMVNLAFLFQIIIILVLLFVHIGGTAASDINRIPSAVSEL
jgi:hypothetical protein